MGTFDVACELEPPDDMIAKSVVVIHDCVPEGHEALPATKEIPLMGCEVHELISDCNDDEEEDTCVYEYADKAMEMNEARTVRTLMMRSPTLVSCGEHN